MDGLYERLVVVAQSVAAYSSDKVDEFFSVLVPERRALSLHKDRVKASVIIYNLLFHKNLLVNHRANAALAEHLYQQ